MKQSTKKLLAMLIACVLACAMLAGCGSTAAPAATEAPAAEGGDTSDLVSSFMETADEPKETVTLEYDANGKVVPGTYVFDDYKADMDLVNLPKKLFPEAKVLFRRKTDRNNRLLSAKITIIR